MRVNLAQCSLLEKAPLPVCFSVSHVLACHCTVGCQCIHVGVLPCTTAALMTHFESKAHSYLQHLFLLHPGCHASSAASVPDTVPTSYYQQERLKAFAKQHRDKAL